MNCNILKEKKCLVVKENTNKIIRRKKIYLDMYCIYLLLCQLMWQL